MENAADDAADEPSRLESLARAPRAPLPPPQANLA